MAIQNNRDLTGTAINPTTGAGVLRALNARPGIPQPSRRTIGAGIGTALNPYSGGIIGGAIGSMFGKHKNQVQTGNQFTGLPGENLSPITYNPNERGSFERGAISQIDSYIDQLAPEQLIQRYKQIAANAGNNVDQYLRQLYGGVATAKDKAYATAYTSAKEMLGRDPDANEFAQLAPLFYSPADFGSGIANGRAALANYADQQAKSPEAQRKNAPQQYGTVDQTIQQFLQRNATQEEKDHFGSLLASGQLDPYELQDFIKSLPEYQSAQDKSFRQGLNTELQGYDTDFFNKAKENVISRFAQNQPGASLTQNPSLDYALTELMGNIAKERGKYLAGLSADQYQGNKANARQDYQTDLERMFGNQDYSRNRSDTLSDYYTQRSNQASDYATQRNDYMSYLNQMGGRRRGGVGAAFGPLICAGIGSFGGLQGAQTGAMIGSGAGGAYDYLNY